MKLYKIKNKTVLTLKDELSFKTPKMYNTLSAFKRENILVKRDKNLIKHVKKHTKKDNGNIILLSGYPKCGNTWLRFVIYNYFNILKNNAKETLTYEDLNKIQKHEYGLTENDEGFKEGFPQFYRTHDPYAKGFKKIDKIIYVCRNPLDNLISHYYFNKKRDTPFERYAGFRRKKLDNIDFYVLYKFNDWLFHYKTTVDKSDIVLSYEEMKKNPYDCFQKTFQTLDFPVKNDILKKSIDYSSFKKIKEMGRKSNQQYGNAGKNFKGEFTRSGKTEQYLEELKPETVKKIKKLLEKNNITRWDIKT